MTTDTVDAALSSPQPAVLHNEPVTAMESLVLQTAPLLDPAWVQYEREMKLPTPRPVIDPVVRQPIYAQECRALAAEMTAPGTRDHHLAQGITTVEMTVPSSSGEDGFAIPVLRYDLAAAAADDGETNSPRTIVVYYHGGGLHVGEADSEDLQCRRILKESGVPGLTTLYSVGYRLMPQHPASTCVADCVDAFRSIRQLSVDHSGTDTKILIVGSSSGGQLAALVSQAVASESESEGSSSSSRLHGVLLRCPVTSDAFSGPEYVPEQLRDMHTSAWDMSFLTSLLGIMKRKVPRDGLAKMPLEASSEELRKLPRHWIQVCTNDMLYSDGVCYARALKDAGVEVQVDVVKGWPHTFWLKAPHLEQAREADKKMLSGLAWVAE
ncbi:uncharacterized protein E0L32_005624 [Thyridium curvatum]|uniref:Alpha/beta hydrolase fold-3 domain-containing protein n=1 Tax=Thyridium curvatum TaxID=1093900 RepID=A0A507B5E5_9PEZI|nr:uncharacterized protein E0L32_005624 [Thyridium curvatum]TPX13924.1 hypothetical protein E0L32_005624 [Thyridium curvatum]